MQRRNPGAQGDRQSDERIRDDVCEQLAGALDIDVSDVNAHVRDGRVELDGTVPERWMKHGIEGIAGGCMRVRDVESRIHARYTGEGGTSQVLRADQRTVSPTTYSGERAIAPIPVKDAGDTGRVLRNDQRTFTLTQQSGYLMAAPTQRRVVEQADDDFCREPRPPLTAVERFDP
ncbi:protein of unknown function [Burkholderia multivorans]